MAENKEKIFIRKIRQGNREFLISLSGDFLKEKNLKVGESIDLRTLEKAKEVIHG